ncbi:RraA family protein [Tissierella sp. Yu-01]|uniref:RraA family protein n=1 Tax=Tissierella sp. Yu-01 TaxID=3035694 RepID=UPI00240D4F9A|nr:RraA family protein [Tissierella sp. Yu-01]WFA08067.1 RraA family protein [Tissierella sp. Yu-01]
MDRLTVEQLKELSCFDTPTVCNALETFNMRLFTEGFMIPGMRLRTENTNKAIVGYATTAKISASKPGGIESNEKLLSYYETIRNSVEPTIAVIQDIDPTPIGSFWGEVQATVHKSLGSIGTLTQGGVRDINDCNRLGFHLFSTEILVSHAYIHVEDYNCEVEVCGLSVSPGDLIHADMHGAVKIPHEIAHRLADACRGVIAAELPMIEPCRKAMELGIKPSIDELRDMRASMVKKRKEVKW